MHGNVSEWIGGPYYEYSTTAVYDPGGPNNGYNSHNRGGNFGSNPENIRSAYRREFTLSRPSWTLGFRLAYKKVTEPPTDLNSTAVLTITENQPVDTIVGEFNATR